MKDIRIGNDIIVSWSIFAEGEPYSLEGKEVTLYLCSQFGKRKAEGYAITGNQITWTFFGKEQKHSGKYSLELVINEDAEGMITTDACDFVNLVDCSCKVGGADDAGVQTESIALTSTLEYVAGSGGGESYDDTYLRTEVARLEREKADKTKLDDLSAEVGQLSERVDNALQNVGEKEWKCIYDADMNVGEQVVQVVTDMEGNPFKAKEIVIDIIHSQEATGAITGYIIINSTTNKTECLYGAVYFSKTGIPSGGVILDRIKFSASSTLPMVAECYDNLKNTIATATNVKGILGNKEPQIYEDISYIKFSANKAIAYSPRIKIYAR